MRSVIAFSALLPLLPACGVGALDALQDDIDGHETSGGSSTTADSESAGGGTGPSGTVTTSPASASAGDTSTTGETDGATSEVDSTGVDPDAPPSISDHALTPNPIQFAGAIDVTVWADADGVRMGLEDGSLVELAPAEPGVFKGEILALTGLDNGGFDAVLTPWRADVEGVKEVVHYTLDLHKPGTEGFWETGDIMGSGQVEALGVLPDGRILEFGTLAGNNTSRCYLRRRDKGGAWDPDDLVHVLADIDCQAIDLEVGDDGAIYLLLNGATNNSWMWWLAKMPTWGAPLKSVGYGSKDEVAEALALSPGDGTLAVCGSAPTVQPDDLVDASVRIFRPDLPGQAQTFDYVKDGYEHAFDEFAKGCEFLDDDTLVVVGEVYGKHVKFDPSRNRRFDLFFDVASNEGDLRVADAPGLVTQSAASDVDVDPDQGRVMIVGHICNDVCEPEGQLWILDPEGELKWSAALGLHPVEPLAPRAVRWSPAGYAVVASGGLKGGEAAFTVRAYEPFVFEPVWTFSRKDAGLLHLALTLAIGPFGEVYAGGFGANGYPLIAYIFS